MEFEGREPIYLQISNLVCENIITGVWKEGDRIPSIRELAVDAEVNPNTVMRAYAHLQERGIIQNRRGIGYFAADSAAARRIKRDEFVAAELPRLFKAMELLDIDFEEIAGHHARYRAGSGQRGGKE